jgi:hypothetical protein
VCRLSRPAEAARMRGDQHARLPNLDLGEIFVDGRRFAYQTQYLCNLET